MCQVSLQGSRCKNVISVGNFYDTKSKKAVIPLEQCVENLTVYVNNFIIYPLQEHFIYGT